ncbi:hypothetical protein [Mycobacterium parascrofulaceum]|uniref:hypothetical protein n=1 Tax=Mycobacterium parascrofulaceum TaxID=240125 RepID=UPI0012F490EC|nr:hypothetical protein [Mycobacterium parascrofulaceum]
MKFRAALDAEQRRTLSPNGPAHGFGGPLHDVNRSAVRFCRGQFGGLRPLEGLLDVAERRGVVEVLHPVPRNTSW